MYTKMKMNILTQWGLKTIRYVQNITYNIHTHKGFLYTSNPSRWNGINYQIFDLSWVKSWPHLLLPGLRQERSYPRAECPPNLSFLGFGRTLMLPDDKHLYLPKINISTLAVPWSRWARSGWFRYRSGWVLSVGAGPGNSDRVFLLSCCLTRWELRDSGRIGKFVA